jgi:hypothetical protein
VKKEERQAETLFFLVHSIRRCEMQGPEMRSEEEKGGKKGREERQPKNVIASKGKKKGISSLLVLYSFRWQHLWFVI